jgi:hypothetical protein
MVNSKSRHHHETVTKAKPSAAPFPVLVPNIGKVPDGGVDFQEGNATHSMPVRRFVPFAPGEPLQDNQKAKKYAAIAKLLALAMGKEIDYSLLKEGFRALAVDAFGTDLADAISARALKNPNAWCRRWLPAIFNREIKASSFVMWWPHKSKIFGPAIYCPDRETALLVSLLVSGIRACIGCGKMFIPKRPDKLYHDEACGHRHRQRRLRQKKGDKS